MLMDLWYPTKTNMMFWEVWWALLQESFVLCSAASNSRQLHTCSLRGSSVHEIFQVRILELVAISSSRGSSWPKDGTHVFCVPLCWQANSLPLHHQGNPRQEIYKKYYLLFIWNSNLTEHVIFLFAMSSNTSFVPTLIWQKRLGCAGMRLLQSL